MNLNSRSLNSTLNTPEHPTLTSNLNSNAALNAKADQNIGLCDRTSGYVTGVKEVISFEPKEIILETIQGGLTIKGSDLHITKLAVDKGIVELTGYVDSIIYSNTSFSKNSTSLFARLFK